MEDVKITSVEKVKDPKRVEAGKRLAAMSKQAKDKKAVERLAQKTSTDEFQIPDVNSSASLALVGVAGFVGAVVYYKYFYQKSDVEQTVETPESKTLDRPKRSEEKPTPKRAEASVPDRREGQASSAHKRRELDTLD